MKQQMQSQVGLKLETHNTNDEETKMRSKCIWNTRDGGATCGRMEKEKARHRRKSEAQGKTFQMLAL